jgi:hypothetical protein
VASASAVMVLTLPAGPGETFTAEGAAGLVGHPIALEVMGIRMAGRVSEAGVVQEGQLLRLTVVVE